MIYNMNMLVQLYLTNYLLKGKVNSASIPNLNTISMLKSVLLENDMLFCLEILELLKLGLRFQLNQLLFCFSSNLMCSLLLQL